MRAFIFLRRGGIKYRMNLYKTAAFVTVCAALEHALGFLYRIVLSRTVGPEGLGVYQLSLTVFFVFLTVCSSGLPVTLSRTIAKHRAAHNRRAEESAVSAAVSIALLFSVPLTVLLFLLRAPFSRVFSAPRCADLFYILLPGLSFTSVYAVLRGSFWGNKRFLAYSLTELAEEIVRIFAGVFLLVLAGTGPSSVNRAAVAVLISYLVSFALALVCFLAKGGKFRAPGREFLPLLRSAAPVTAMRTASSLVNSLISVVFPMRLMAAGLSSARAMSAYGVVCGMVMPVIQTPGTLIGSLALVLVPELSECFYRGDREKLSALVGKALGTALFISCLLAPFFIVCGNEAGILLFGNAECGRLIARSALILLPMSLTMISTSVLNSMNCERYTLLFFLLGSGAMLVCVWFLPKYLGSGALLVGMAADYTLTAACSLLLLRKKTGKRRHGYLLRLAAAAIPPLLLGLAVRALCMKVMGCVPALFLAALTVLAAEIALTALLKLANYRTLFKKFLPKKRAQRSAAT